MKPKNGNDKMHNLKTKKQKKQAKTKTFLTSAWSANSQILDVPQRVSSRTFLLIKNMPLKVAGNLIIKFTTTEMKTAGEKNKKDTLNP